MRQRFGPARWVSAGSIIHAAVTTASLSLSGCIPAGTDLILISPSAANLRLTWDGTAPSANYGLLLPAGLAPYEYRGPTASLALRGSTSGSVDCAPMKY